jgi:hypothetical protein
MDSSNISADTSKFKQETLYSYTSIFLFRSINRIAFAVRLASQYNQYKRGKTQPREQARREEEKFLLARRKRRKGSREGVVVGVVVVEILTRRLLSSPSHSSPPRSARRRRSCTRPPGNGGRGAWAVEQMTAAARSITQAGS